MKRILFFISVLCVAFLWQGCEEKVVFGSIYGVVTDRSTGEPIRNAEVTLSPSNKTAIIGSSGTFEFINLEPGQYSVSVEAKDYQYNNKMVTVVAGESATCDFHLDKIKVEQELEISPSSLNFGAIQEQMSVTITNKGTEATSWSLDLGNNKWLSVTPISGRIDAKKMQTIVFKVDRSLLAKDETAVVSLSAFGNSYPLTISCAIKQNKGILNVAPTVLDFGVEATEMSFIVKNIGDASLSWYIRDLFSLDLTLSEESGDLEPGASKIVKVLLDREWLTKDLSTSFIVSDGSTEQEIKVLAKYYNNSDDNGGSNGGDDDNGGNQGDNDVSIVNPFSTELSISNIKCVGYKGSGIVHFQFTATNIDNSSASNVRFYFGKSELSDEYGNTYNTGYVANVNLPVDVPVIVRYDTQSTQVTGVDISAKKFTQISIYVETPKSRENLVLKNVPIEWVDDSSTDNGIKINNPFPAELSISNIKCVGYKGSGIVHFQFTATNIDNSSASNVRFYFGKSELSDEYGNTYNTGYVANVNLPVDVPVIVRYDTQSTQVTGVDISAKKFTQISIYVETPKSRENLVFKDVPIEWKDDSSSGGVSVNNPFPTELSISNVKCVGYKDSRIVHFQFTATNIDNSSTSDVRFYFGNCELYDEYGNTYKTGYVANVNLPVDVPVIVKYNTQYTQVTGVDTSAKKFAQISIYVDTPKSNGANLVLKNVPIEWQ